MAQLVLESAAFAEGEAIPRKYTCEGEEVSPPLTWSGVPAGTRSLALVVLNMDSPSGAFTHWLGWGLGANSTGLAEGESPPVEGLNDFGTIGYRGPCPTPRHRPHRYLFRFRALDCALALEPGARFEDLRSVMKGHVLEGTQLLATYER